MAEEVKSTFVPKPKLSDIVKEHYIKIVNDPKTTTQQRLQALGKLEKFIKHYPPRPRPPKKANLLGSTRLAFSPPAAVIPPVFLPAVAPAGTGTPVDPVPTIVCNADEPNVNL